MSDGLLLCKKKSPTMLGRRKVRRLGGFNLGLSGKSTGMLEGGTWINIRSFST